MLCRYYWSRLGDELRVAMPPFRRDRRCVWVDCAVRCETSRRYSSQTSFYTIYINKTTTAAKSRAGTKIKNIWLYSYSGLILSGIRKSCTIPEIGLNIYRVVKKTTTMVRVIGTSNGGHGKGEIDPQHMTALLQSDRINIRPTGKQE